MTNDVMEKQTISVIMKKENNLTSFYLSMKRQFGDKYTDDQINKMWFTGSINSSSPLL